PSIHTRYLGLDKSLILKSGVIAHTEVGLFIGELWEPLPYPVAEPGNTEKLLQYDFRAIELFDDIIDWIKRAQILDGCVVRVIDMTELRIQHEALHFRVRDVFRII